MAFPQTKTPLSLTVCKRQRRRSSAVPLLLPVQSPAPQCASNNARPVITGACRSRLLGRRCRPFSRKARRGSSHGHPALPCTIRQLSAAFFPGTLSRHSRIFHCPGVYSPARGKSSDTARRIFHLVCIRSESISDKGSAGVCGRRSCGKAEEAALSVQRTSDIPESSILRPISQLFYQKVVKTRQRFFFLCFRFSAEHSFICCCVKLIFSKFSTIFRKIVRSRFPVRLFTAPSVSPDMQNTPPNFEILAVYFEAKRWYINFVRTFCGQRTCIHAAVSKRRDNFDREVIGVFWYHCVMERLYHPACGAYTSFGIAAHSTSHGRHRKLRFISDVSVDPVRVLRLAARCTACQLDPSQLMDVVEDLLAE